MPKHPFPSETDLVLLRRIVGDSHCLSDPDLKARYERDWTGRYGGPSSVVVRPGTVAEVSALLSYFTGARIPVVPQGGNTGLVGGSVPHSGEAILSLERLSGVVRCDSADAGDPVLEAGAGTTLAAAQREAAAHGFELGIDLAARDSATLGGMVATNAGGVHVVRHGSMRSRLAGLELVLADGSVVSRLSGLVKDNVGYDIASLMAGSEGTLGVVTTVLVRLVPVRAHRVTALLALRGDAQGVTVSALTISATLRRAVDGIEAVELMYAPGVALVRSHGGLGPPPDPGADAYLLVEAAGASDPTAGLASVVEAHPEVSGSAVATDPPGRARLWAYRELHTGAIATLGVAHKLDVSLPPDNLPRFVALLPEVVAAVAKGALVICFGHLADGNLHVNVVGPDPSDDRSDLAVLRLALSLGGSISAEHGVGVAKLALVAEQRSPADIAAMRRIKRALDPAGILNPGVLLPPD